MGPSRCLRLGRFRALKGPGLFFINPVIDSIPYWIDTRVITSSFMTERTLTKDTVPVNVDAVLFWKIADPVKVALTLQIIKAPSILQHKQRCAMSSVRQSCLTCLKVGKRSA